ncbi:hypothetical protein [Parasphingopyxis marina]|uniref:DUF429 domain-containing protein n=1 Tax=Parasphingopyxis marina TaxID=2761622 RepID=A0A842HZ37_9SPHN|nr:hypothetical protein [Parasphingopyxis marina]MBC2777200.1 hypothetical protein [Parasphingopyxis marina]
MRRFSRFACFDWSGQAVERPKGIALAIAGAGAKAPALAMSANGWSREDALGWLLDRAAEKADLLIGFDFSAALPFVDHGSYFPSWPESPGNARSLWAAIDALCNAEPHLSASRLTGHRHLARHFRYQQGRTTITGEGFEGGRGRLRITEKHCRQQQRGNAVSCFNLVGAAQVGKSSLTGMRLLHRLDGAIPVWPFDPVPDTGPMILEIYTSIAARDAGLTGRTKMRDAIALDAALDALGSSAHAPLGRYDDHSTDALLTAAWMRQAAGDIAFWKPAACTDSIAQQEGWTFGVR